MAKLLALPAVAAGSTEAVVAEWMVEENTVFAAGEVLATVETDKALVEVEVESAGVVLTRLVPAGAKVEVGAAIAVLGEPDEQVDDLNTLLTELGVSSDRPVTRPERRELSDLGEPAQQAAPVATGDGRDDANGDPAGRIFISPLARRLARAAGLTPADITGTGPSGRIVRRDVEAAIAGRPPRAAASSEAPLPEAAMTKSASSGRAQAPTNSSDGSAPVIGLPPAPTGAAPFTAVPHSRIRRATASRLTASMQQIPHFYLRGSARADRLLKLRRQLVEATGLRISVNDLIVKAVARAHVTVPEMNVTWTSEAVRSYANVDIGVAVATGRGLLTPVLRGVESLPISAVATGMRDLGDRAAAGRLREDELHGGSITLSNLGMYGVEEFSAIINPPQSAILAIGAAKREAVVGAKGRLQSATVIRFTLSVDHRPLDGVVAARWMDAFIKVIENPLGVLA